MSGGMFEYKQYHITDIIDTIEKEIQEEQFNDALNMEFEDEFKKNKVLIEIKNGLFYLKMARIYAQRIDYLFSGDDGFESILYNI